LKTAENQPIQTVSVCGGRMV